MASAEPPEPMMMGSFCHKLMEVYYKSIAVGNKPIDALKNVELFSLPPDSDIILSEIKQSEVRQRFREYVYTYNGRGDISPLMPEAIEVGFSYPIVDTVDRLYILEGRIDIIGTLQGMRVVMDHKLQVRRKDLYKKSIQFRNYAMATHTNVFMINYIRMAKAVDKDTFVRDIASFTELEHRLWREELIKIYDRVWEAQDSGKFVQNWASCSGKYNYPCEFIPLCEEIYPQVLQAKKSTLYKIREEWKPW